MNYTKMKYQGFFLTLLFFIAGQGLAGDPSTPIYKFNHSIVIDQTTSCSWPNMRDFVQVLDMAFGGNIQDVTWINGTNEENIPAQVQFVLTASHPLYGFLATEADALITEEVNGRLEDTHTMHYRTIGVAIVMVDYQATYSLQPVTQDPTKTLLTWSREFSLVEGVDPNEFIPAYDAMVDQEMANIKQALEGNLCY